jgi:hypothetical protein
MHNIVKFNPSATLFHVCGKVFEADVYLEYEVQERFERDITMAVQFSIYCISPKLRVYGITGFVKRPYVPFQKCRLFQACWPCSEYMQAIKHFIHICTHFKDANKIMLDMGLNYRIVVSYKTVCDFMYFSQQHSVTLIKALSR